MKTISILLVLLAAAVLPAPVKAEGDPIGGALATAIEVHVNHSHFEPTMCVITPTRGVKCWGSNTAGRLGNGSIASSSDTPVDVVGLSSGVKKLVINSGHFCALLDSGKVMCWGENDYGQVGVGPDENTSIPFEVIGIPDDIIDVQTFDYVSSSFALTSHGALWCWGDCEGLDFDPRVIPGLDKGVKQFNAQEGYLCVLMYSGGVKCDDIQYGYDFTDVPGFANYRTYTPVIAK